MSGPIENQAESKKNLKNMSSRQQVLYLLNKTQKVPEWTIDKEQPNESEDLSINVDFNQIFLENKEKVKKSRSKNVQIEINRSVKNSLKEYTHIKKNIYLDRKKFPFSDDDAFVCSCEKPTSKRNEKTKPEVSFSCGKACINRMVSWECVEHLCPSGVSCMNRRFQLQQYSEVYPVLTQDRGWGLCAGEKLPKGSFVIQYIGEIYSVDSEIGIEKIKSYRNKPCTYLMSISKNEVIDPTYKGNMARFINHSCDPNCETQKWHVLGEVCVGIFTLRDIEEGEELTFNYGFDILKTTFLKCLCKSKNCKGYLGVAQKDTSIHNQYTDCEKCGVQCRNSDSILVCENCKKIYHKSCLKSLKLIDGLFYCKICIPKFEKKSKKKEIEKSESIKKSEISDPEIKDEKNALNSRNEVSEAPSLNFEINMEVVADKFQPSENFSSIFHSKSFKIEKESNPTAVDQNRYEWKESNDNTLSNEKKAEETEKKEEVPENYFKIEEGSLIKEQSVNEIPSDEIVEEICEVEGSHLKLIKSNLKNLSYIGARLFWDYRQNGNNESGIEIKISGTKAQISRVIQAIKNIIEENRMRPENVYVNINVPKIFLRKIVGHQLRNLMSYKMKHNVEIEYDLNLITDEIYTLNEFTVLRVIGNENNVEIVQKKINAHLENLKLMTIYLLNTDYNMLKNNICQIKNSADPADLRLRKKESKLDKEIKHSFYYVPNSTKDLVIIGDDSEITKGEKVVREFLLRQNILENNYSLCFLCPVYLNNVVANYKSLNTHILRSRNVFIKVIEPNFSRKHLNVYMEGKWKDIIDVKHHLFAFFDQNNFYLNNQVPQINNINSNFNSNLTNSINNKMLKKSSIDDFQQYAYNQEMKLISKNIRKSFLEPNYTIKNWDLITTDLTNEDDDNFNRTNEKSSHLKRFLSNTDRDTVLNHLLYLPTGSYKEVFNLNRGEVVKNIIEYLEENYDSFVTNKTGTERRDYNVIRENSFQNQIYNNTSFIENSEKIPLITQETYDGMKSISCFSEQFEVKNLNFENSNNRNFKEIENKNLSTEYPKHYNIRMQVDPVVNKTTNVIRSIVDNSATTKKDSIKIPNNDKIMENVIKIDYFKKETKNEFLTNPLNLNIRFENDESNKEFLNNKRKKTGQIENFNSNYEQLNESFTNSLQQSKDNITQKIYIINNYNLSNSNKKNQIKDECTKQNESIMNFNEKDSNLLKKKESGFNYKSRPKFNSRFKNYSKNRMSPSSSNSDKGGKSSKRRRNNKKQKRKRKSPSSSFSSSNSSKNSKSQSVSPNNDERRNDDSKGEKSRSDSRSIQRRRALKSKSNSKDSRSNHSKSNKGESKFNFQKKMIMNKKDSNISHIQSDYYKKEKDGVFFNKLKAKFLGKNSFGDKERGSLYKKNKFKDSTKQFKRDEKRRKRSSPSDRSNNSQESSSYDSINKKIKSESNFIERLGSLNENSEKINEYLFLRKNKAKMSDGAEMKMMTEINILNCPISIRSSLKNPFKPEYD